MFSGKCFSADLFQIRLNISVATAAFSGKANVQWTAQAVGLYQPDFSGVPATSFTITLQGQIGDQVVTGTSYSVVGHGVNYSHSDPGYNTSPSLLYEISNLRIYMNYNANWDVVYDGWKLYDSNATVIASGGGSEVINGMEPNPSSIPFPAGMIQFSASGTVNLTGQGTDIYLDYSGDCSVTATCGYRWQKNGAWHNPPITMPDYSVVHAGDYGDCEPSLSDIVSGSDTWNLNFHCHNYYNYRWLYQYTDNSGNPVYSRWLNSYATTCSCIPIPDVSKGVSKQGTDYAALVFRAGFPQVTSHAFTQSAAQGLADPGVVRGLHGNVPVVHTYESFPVTYAAESQFLGTVTSATHPIEDALSKPVYSMVGISAQGGYWANNNFVAFVGGNRGAATNPNPPNDPRCNLATYQHIHSTIKKFVMPYDVADFGGSFELFSNLQSGGYLPFAYNNNWANPAWSYVLWFPPENAGNSIGWKVDGTVETPQAYWLNLRQQFLTHPSLPPADNKQCRNNLVAEPLYTNGMAGFMDNQVFGQITSYWGVSRFYADPERSPASRTYSLADPNIWLIEKDTGGNPTTATITFNGSGVVVTPLAGHKSCKIKLLLPSFDDPMLYAVIADKITFTWAKTGTANDPTILWLAYDGTATPQDLSGGQGTYAKPSGTSAHYMGTWAEDWSQRVTTDLGTDTIPKVGISAPAYGDASLGWANEFSVPFGSTRQYVYVEWDLSGADDQWTFTIKYPTLYDSKGESVYWEKAQRAAIVKPNAGIYRWGTMAFFDGFSIVDVPLEQPYMLSPSAGDWLCWKRKAWRGAHITGNNSLDLEIRSIYDYGYEFTKDSHLWADPFTGAQVTHSFVAPTSSGLTGIMVNSYAEVPPVAIFANTARNALLQPTPGSCSNQSYSWAPSRQYIVEPTDGKTTSVTNSSGVAVPDQVAVTAPAGWTVTGYRPVLTGAASEQGFKLLHDGKDVAHFRPWHGSSYSHYVVKKLKGKISFDVAKHGRHVKAWINSANNNNASLKLYANADLSNGKQVDTSIACNALCVRWTKDQSERIALMYVDSGNAVKLTYSSDEGKSWSMPTTLSNSGIVPAFVLSGHGTRYYYWLADNGNSGYKIQGQIRDNNDNVLVNTFDVVNNVDSDGLAVDESYGANAAHRITLVYSVNNVLTSLTSMNGKVFS